MKMNLTATIRLYTNTYRPALDIYASSRHLYLFTRQNYSKALQERGFRFDSLLDLRRCGYDFHAATEKGILKGHYLSIISIVSKDHKEAIYYSSYREARGTYRSPIILVLATISSADCSSSVVSFTLREPTLSFKLGRHGELWMMK
jgi:hypothetical protein